MYKIRDRVKLSKIVLILLQIAIFILINTIYPTEGKFDINLFYSLYLLFSLITIYLVNRKFSVDEYLFILVNLLNSIGILMIYRLNPHLATRQTIYSIISIIAYIIILSVDLKFFKLRDYYRIYLLGIYSVFIITLLFASRNRGAKNWISLWGIGFQPSEFVKFLYVFFLASYYSVRDYNLKKRESFFLLFVNYSLMGFLFLQTDLGMSLIFFSVFTCLQFIYDNNTMFSFLNIGSFILFSLASISVFNHIKIRLISWLDPWTYIDSYGYQITQSLFAICEGSFLGKGLGLGRPDMIPEVHTDFIFSAICEEMGLLVGIGLIIIYLMISYRAFRIAFMEKKDFKRFIIIGMAIILSSQTLIILGGVTKLLPLTGLTLPFVSYGGSSLLASYIALALIERKSIEGDRYEK